MTFDHLESGAVGMNCVKCGAPTNGKYARYCAPCRAKARTKPSRWKPSDSIDALIREAWTDPLLHGKAACLWVQERMEKPTWPKWKICRRAVSLDVARKEPKEPPWSKRELQILEEFAWLSPERIKIKFAREGFTRTRVAIHLKRRRLRLYQNLDGYSARRASDLLGVDVHKVTKWITRGWLHAAKRGTERVGVQGGDIWYIPHASVRKFVLSHLDEIDLAKVDKLWFVSMITNERLAA